MKKVVVNDNVCIGCGFCAATLDTVFKMNDEDRAMTIDEKNELEKMNEEQQDNIMDILEGCPVGAIEIVEE